MKSRKAAAAVDAATAPAPVCKAKPGAQKKKGGPADPWPYCLGAVATVFVGSLVVSEFGVGFGAEQPQADPAGSVNTETEVYTAEQLFAAAKEYYEFDARRSGTPPAERAEAATQLLAASPADRKALEERGVALLELGRVEEGIADFERLLPAVDIGASARQAGAASGKLGQAQLQLLHYDEAVDSYSTAIEWANATVHTRSEEGKMDPVRLGEAVMVLDNSLVGRAKCGDHGGANPQDQQIADCTAVINGPLQTNLVTARFVRGEVLRTQGKLEDSLEDMTLALEQMDAEGARTGDGRTQQLVTMVQQRKADVLHELKRSEEAVAEYTAIDTTLSDRLSSWKVHAPVLRR
jgi:tetratricopeptide (TPR) repeat protein